MASRVLASAAVMALTAGLFGVLPAAAAGPVEPLTIVFVVVDHAQVPETALTRAQAEAARIYRSFGIIAIWSNTSASSVDTQITINIIVKPGDRHHSVPDDLAAKSADWRVLGVAPGHKERHGLEVWAFYERILDVANILGIDPGLLLGHVIAHELGHLLLPYDSHSQTGLMRSGWDKSQAANALMGNLRFNQGEAGLIRRRVARMAADHPASITPMTVERTPN